MVIAGEARVTPVGKAVEMLQGLLLKTKEGKQLEEVQYASFKQYCDDATVRKQQAVREADDKIEMLEAHVLKFNTEAARLGKEVEGHKSDIVGWESDTNTATDVRSRERSDFVATQKNYTESITALTQAITVLKEQAFDRTAPVGSLLQQEASDVFKRMPPFAAQAIEVFLSRGMLEEEPDLTFVVPPPQAAAYEFRSDDIIAMLERLKDKFRDERAALDKEELERRHAYENVVSDLRNSINAGKADEVEKTRSQAQNKQNAADSSAELDELRKTRAEENGFLDDLVATCLQKRNDFESRQKLRGEEIDALEKALQLLSSSAVAGAAEKHLPAASLFERKGNVLAQLRGSSSKSAQRAPQARAAAFLAAASERLGSRLLSTVAARSREGPFDKVKQLIQELLDRLIAEAGEEATHKTWCDTELAANQHTRTTKSEETDLLMDQIDKLQSDIAILEREIADISAGVAALSADIVKQTNLRNAEKARNEQTLQEARDAQTALAEAISLLKDFYGKAADATAFAQAGRGVLQGGQVRRQQGQRREEQRQQPAAPPIFDAAYKGMQDESGGVLAMLDVIQSDFARLEGDTADAENSASNQHDTFMSDSAADKALRESELGQMQGSLTSKEGELLSSQGDLENARLALAAAQAYLDKLRPSCLNAGGTFEERVQRREEEIESLKEALRILNGEDVAVVRGVLVKNQGAADQGTLRSATTGLDYKQ